MIFLAALCAQSTLDFAGPRDDIRSTPARTLDSLHLFQPPRSLEQWNTRRAALRRRVLVAAGLWPMPVKRPIEARISAAIARSGYTVEGVAFESFPGFFVTGSLYRPDPAPAGLAPAVLSPHGHWNQGRFCQRSEAEGRAEVEQGAEQHLTNARFHLQARCASLARMGAIVFHYDMVGYADARPLEHGAGFEDADALLELESAFGLQTWNSIRALDFLAALPGVDATRLAVTGASGGGTQTFILCAVDDRPSVAFPAVMVSARMQGGCVCENAPYLRLGTDNVELAALTAPRPLGLTGANDWTIAIETEGLPELTAVYALYDRSAAVLAQCFPQFEHNYNQVSREFCYQWFGRWLGLQAPSAEAEIVPIEVADLSAWPPGSTFVPEATVLEAVRTTWRADVRAELDADERIPRTELEFDRWRDQVLPALGILLDEEPGLAFEVRAREVARERGASGERVELWLERAGTGECVPASQLVPEHWNGRIVVAVDDAGRASFFSGATRLSAERTAAAGALFLAIDPYGCGTWLTERDALPARIDASRHEQYVGYSYAYERPLVAERVRDILTAIRYARSLEGSRGIVLVGLNEASSWAWLARVLAGGAVQRTILERGGDPWEVELATDPALLPGIRRYRGKYDLAPIVFPAELVCFGRGNWLRHAADYYAACGRADCVRELDALEALDLAPWIDAPLDR